MKPLVRRDSVSLSPPSSLDKTADKERLFSSLNYKNLEIPLPLIKSLPQVLRENDYSLTLAICKTESSYRIVSFLPERITGIALDIGTTNIIGRLLDLESGVMVSQCGIVNPQREFGPDLLTRMHFAMLNGVEELNLCLIASINELIQILCSESECQRGDIAAMTISCNTVMTHLLMGFPVDFLPVEPYVPVTHNPGFQNPVDLGIEINPNGVIYLFPNAGTYVGGDIISGILATGIHTMKVPAVLIDVGTNAEMVIGTEEWIIAGSGAAGPALEEGIADIGEKATEGSVCEVKIESESFEVILKTIGHTGPTGFCASGMVSLIAEMFRSGIIDKNGRLDTNKTGVLAGENEKYFEFFTEAGKRLIVREREVLNFLRSKAGMFTAFYVLSGAVGVKFHEIERFYISGALGNGIKMEDARTLGMLPDLPDERFRFITNTSLLGAELLLKDKTKLQEIELIIGIITYKEMNEDNDFMREFPSAMFIPHTNPEVLRGGV